jgi:Glycosyl hydrolases family 28
MKSNSEHKRLNMNNRYLITHVVALVVIVASLAPVSLVAAVVPPPQPHFKPSSYGAKADGVTYDTEAIQKAIDACAGTGGSVILAPGQYVSAGLTLRGHMTFYLEKGAVLLGGTNAVDYPVIMPDNTPAKANCRSLLYACKADDLIIDGEGELDGRCKQVNMSGRESMRPSLLRVFQSRNVAVRNITLRNPRMWTQVYSECDNLLIDHVTVDAPPDCPNLDGMDICDSRDVIIRNCDVRSEDDSICLKSHGARGLQNITVENNRICSFHANGIKLGTATVGPISHLIIRSNVVTYAKLGGVCIESVDGSAVRDVLVQDMDLARVGQPVFIRLARRTGGSGDLERGVRPVGSVDGVTIDRLRALATHNETRASCSITGIPEARIRNVRLKDCYLEMPGGIDKVPGLPPEREKDYPQSNLFGNTPAYAFFIRHADGVVLENVTVCRAQADTRPWLALDDAQVATPGSCDLGQVRMR